MGCLLVDPGMVIGIYCFKEVASMTIPEGLGHFPRYEKTLNPEDDNYGLEMATYLNEDDILKPVQTKSYSDGIKHFCVPLSESTEIDTRQFRRKRRNSAYITDFHEDCGVNSGQVCNRKTKKRKTDLPDIEIQQEEILSDEVELPPFDLDDKNPIDKGLSKRFSCILNENQMFEDSKERQYNLKPSEKCFSSDALVNQMKCAPQKNLDNCKETLPMVMQKSYNRRKMESDLLRKNSKGVKKNHTKVRQSVVEVIADLDDHDFDMPEKNEFQNSDQLNPISSPGNECDRIVFSNIDELSNINFDVEDENIREIFKLLPLIRGVRHSNSHKLIGAKDIDNACSVYSVRSPPSVVDMVETLNAPHVEHGSICLDITQIAEEWEKENQINNSGDINSVLDLEKCENNFEKFKKGPAELPSVCQKQLGSSKNIHAQLDSIKNKSENPHVSKISKLVNDLTTYTGIKEELKKLSENFEHGPTDVLRNGISDSKCFTVHSEESISLEDALLVSKHDNEGTVPTLLGNPGMNQDGGSSKHTKQGNFDICKVEAKTSVNSKQQLLSIGRDDVRHEKALVSNKQTPAEKFLVLNAEKMDNGVTDLESHKNSDDSDIEEMHILCLEMSRKCASSSLAKNCTSLVKRSPVVSCLNHGHDGHKDCTDKLSDVTDIIPLNQKEDSSTEKEIISSCLKSLKSRICSKFEKSVCDFPDGDSRYRQNQILNIAQGDTSSLDLDKNLNMHGYSPSSDSRSKLNSRNKRKDINSQQTCSEDSITKMQTKLLLPICDTENIEHEKVYLEKDRSRIDSSQFVRNNSFNEIFGDDSDFDGLEAVETSWAKKDTSTQFTFTQALDCVNNSLVLSTEPTDTSSGDRHLKGIAASVSKQKAVDANFNEAGRSDSRVVNSMAAPFMHMSEKDKESLPLKETHITKENTKYQKQNHDAYLVKNTANYGPTTSGLSNFDDDQIEFPEFDLGFDLDEDIVPPSPCSTKFSQSSLSNQKSFYSRRSLKLSSKDESLSEHSCIVPSDSKIQIVKHAKLNLNSRDENKSDDVFVGVNRKNNNNNQTGKGNFETIVEVFDLEKEQSLKNTGNEDKLRRKSFNYIVDSKSLDVERQNKNGIGSDEKLQRMDQDMQDEEKIKSFNSEDLKRHNNGSVAKGNDCSYAVSDKTKMNLTSRLEKMGKGLSVGHDLASNKQTKAIKNMHTVVKSFPTEDKSNEDFISQEEEVVFVSFSLQYEDDLLKELVQTEDQSIAKSVGQYKPLTQSSQGTKFRRNFHGTDTHVPHLVENTNGEEPDIFIENDSDMQNMSVANESDMDDSFVVMGKKRKMAILSSPESPDYSSKIRKMDSGNLDCQSSIMNTDLNDTKSSKACLSFDLANVQNENEDEDFKSSSLWFSKQAQNKDVEKPKRLVKGSVKIKSDIEKEVNSCMATRDRKKKGSLRSNPFIEHEAEVDEDDLLQVSEDEADHSDLDHWDESFINDATQVSQAQDDMHAIYLKSIRSPIHHPERGRFKLQNHYHRRNVFSQIPEEDESQYMEDSFCVADEDVEELSLVSEDDDEAEIKILKEISAPRRRRTRNSKKENFKAKLKATNKTNRRWMRTIADSSSSDEELDKKENVNSSKKEFSRTFEMKKGLFLPSIDDEEDVCDNAITNMCISKNNTYVHGFKESVCAMNTNPVVKDIHCKTTEELRQERLKRQKEKQEEFRRKTAEMAGLQNIKIGCDMKDKEHGKMEEQMTKLKSKISCTSVENATKPHKNEPNIITPKLKEEESSMDMITDINTRKSAKKFVLLVDSREISGAQDIVSTLRFQHNIHVCAAQLPGCDYIVSNRMAVDRKQWSEFSNGSNRVRLIERMQYFAELYDQPCLILESDRTKLGDDKSHRPIHWTKYVDKTLSQLIRSNIRLFYTNDQIETAALLAELCQLEHRKNMAISVPLELNSQQQSIAEFLCTVPKLSYIHVLNLCNGFRTLSDLVDSSVTSIEKKGQISQSRAMEVYMYIRRIFNSNILPVN
ncbi:hypothetical protein CHS0354_038943 [Potamilus streckersoni]|uniref:ERCC4 domain-containing protein n=1 Tax=Potamilus streckersoni TaxID=2493646 RepID=A0AAE0S135_9BIVA|nr:hypothetical protein CHS0354_038943 [Potamilus streckersoni]